MLLIAGTALPTDALELRNVIGRFSTSIIQYFLNNSHTNVIISPIAIHTNLCTTLMGTRGQTSVEIRQTTRLVPPPVTRDQIGNAYRALLEPLQSNDANLRAINKIYVHNTLRIKSDYQTVVGKNFFASAQSIDFSQLSAAAKTINAEVAALTHNRITNIVDPLKLSKDPKIVLVNAVHFKAAWQCPFHNNENIKAAFYPDGKPAILWDFMQRVVSFIGYSKMIGDLSNVHVLQEKFGYANLPNQNAVLISLPYTNRDYSFNVILPNKENGGNLAQLKTKLHSVDLSTLSDTAKPKLIDIWLPKFEARFKFALKSSLQRAGLRTIFTTAADFSDLLVNHKNIGAREVVHEAYFRVDESGTEGPSPKDSAGNTGYDVPETESPLEVRIDRPFAYYVQDRHNRIILLGHHVG